MFSTITHLQSQTDVSCKVTGHDNRNQVTINVSYTFYSIRKSKITQVFFFKQECPQSVTLQARSLMSLDFKSVTIFKKKTLQPHLDLFEICLSTLYATHTISFLRILATDLQSITIDISYTRGILNGQISIDYPQMSYFDGQLFLRPRSSSINFSKTPK
jgi:hypothetical protein